MPAYDFQCPRGHTTTISQSIHDELPATVPCDAKRCRQRADRQFHAPAAIHFRGRGFYATDVKGAQERRRRPNPGDDLYRPHDPDAAAIARSL